MLKTGATGSGVAALGILLALTGCVPGVPTPVPSQTAASSPSPSSAPAPVVLVEGGTAQENLAYFDKVNIEHFTGKGIGTSLEVIDSLVAAGFRKQDMEVTEDRTSIDLPVDSLIFSVRVKGECLIGDYQLTTGYTSLIAPLLGTGGCLIGTTVPLG